MYFITGEELQVECKITLLFIKLVFVILANLKLFNSSFDENSFKWPFSQNLIKSLYL